jgi:membrane-associated phospholipid phosphatase
MSLAPRSALRSCLASGRTSSSPFGGRPPLQILFALAVPILSACADRVTDPASSPSLSSSTSTTRSFPTVLATVGWEEQGRILVANHPVTMSPIVAARVYALLGVSQYGAVVDADNQVAADGVVPDDGFGEGGRRRFEARRGAIAGASEAILSHVFADASGTLAQRRIDEGNAGPGGVHPWFTRGVAIGQAFAELMWARNDRFANAWTGSLLVGEGYWTRNAAVNGVLAPIAGPQFGAMKAYFFTDVTPYHSATPPAFGSPAFLTDLAQVSSISLARTTLQRDSAVAWNLANGSVTALGRWDEFAGQFITEDGLDELAAAHVFALTNAAAMDAVIACWESKFAYDYIRPYQVDQVHYPITTPLGTPNHPSYPSGHSCVSAAAATVIKAFFATRGAWLDARVIDAGRSRILGGLHYQFDITAGQALGRAVAANALNYDRDHGLLAAVR